MFVDGDDLLKKDWIGIINKSDYKNYECTFFSKDISNIQMDKRELLENALGMLNGANIASTVSKIYNKNFLKNNKIELDSQLINGEDMIFNVKCIAKIKSYKIINQSFYKYRINNKSATHNFNEKIFKTDKYFQYKLKEILDNDTNYAEEYKLQIEYFNLASAIYVLCDRIAYEKKIKSRMKYYKLINSYPYNNLEIKRLHLDKWVKIINVLVKMHLYILIDFYFKRKHYKNLGKKGKEYFMDF